MNTALNFIPAAGRSSGQIQTITPSPRFVDLAREMIEECVLPDLLSMADELSAANVPVKVTVSDFDDPLFMRQPSVAAWVTIEACPAGSSTPLVLGFAGKATERGWRVEVFTQGVRRPKSLEPCFTEDPAALSSFASEHFEKFFLPYFCIR